LSSIRGDDGLTSTPVAIDDTNGPQVIGKPARGGAYTGFVAGVFSGVAKLSVGYDLNGTQYR
jgi:hypothetical protein